MNLSATERSYLKDPVAFEKRLDERAATLWEDGYGVTINPETGVFDMTAPNGATYPVNLVTRTCTCAFSQKRETPCECKHIKGLPVLIEEQLSQFKMFAEQHEIAGYPDRAAQRWCQYAALLGHLNSALELREANAMEMDLETYRQAVHRGEVSSVFHDRMEREIREAGYAAA